MKRSVSLLIVCLMATLAAAAPEKEYPLRVQILQSSWSANGFGVHGFGRGNITDAQSTRGFDFTYNCSSSYNTTTGNLAYLGRWKKEEERLVIQGSQIGGHGKSECEMKTLLQHDVYATKNGQLFLVSQEQFKSLTESLCPSDNDPAHYPLKIAILSVEWRPATFGSMGVGKGNIYEGSNSEGFNYVANCAVSFQADGGVFSGKWEQEKTRLVLLAKGIGENRLYNCQLKVDLVSGVYAKNNNTGVITFITHDAFKQFLDKNRAVPVKMEAGTLPAGSGSNSSKARVSVSSVPDGADIEIDGKYVGSTPSLLEWPVGEHSVCVKKPSYKEWNRKITLAAGEVKVNANLEKAEGTN